ncbi:papilin-like [Physella acuta]|uniref:papilin-like n=1 Tax=Physella acuta TaxID=109671 RepID=UPI0027DE5288|nr:papilin-like [Physella acuta]
MSSAGTCPCHLDWSTDIHGARREPVNNEKAWLIFAVRLLSRTVVGKVNGQETVWSQRFKPSWWDQEVGLAWKNPTTNPKDTKQVLVKKFEALQRHLKNEGKFPEVLEGEARLWNAGKFSDLFFMTSVLGVLEKTIDLHNAVTQLCARKGSRIFPDLTLVGSIKNCLAATFSKLDQIGTSDCGVFKTSDSGVNSRTFTQLDQLGASNSGLLKTSDSGVLETSDSGVNSRTFLKLDQIGTSNSGVLKTSDSGVLETSDSGVNSRTFLKLDQIGTSDSGVLETSESAVFKTSDSGVLETPGRDVLKTSNIAANGRAFSKLNQLGTSDSDVSETSGSDVLVTSNSAVFKKSDSGVLETSGSDVLETSNIAVNGRTFSKLNQLGTSNSGVLETSGSDVLLTSNSAVNGRTFSKLGQLGTSYSTVLVASDSDVLQTSYNTVLVLSDSDVLETSYNTVKCRTHKRRSSLSSRNSSNVSPHKSPKIDTPAVKNSQPTSDSVG